MSHSLLATRFEICVFQGIFHVAATHSLYFEETFAVFAQNSAVIGSHFHHPFGNLIRIACSSLVNRTIMQCRAIVALIKLWARPKLQQNSVWRGRAQHGDRYAVITVRVRMWWRGFDLPHVPIGGGTGGARGAMAPPLFQG